MALEPAGLDSTVWEELLELIEHRRVIPVVGAELLTIEEDGRTVPLYRAVGERLLRKCGFPAAASRGGEVLREHCELHDAVCALAATGKRVKDLYRPVHDILDSLLGGQTEPLPALRELASIRDFDLFVSTTPDDLMARALDAVRFHGAAQTDQIEYAPKLPTERRRDIPEMRSSTYTAVFYLFGKADVSPFYAIHDEDALEFAYTLQAGNAPERVFSHLRGRNLLLMGCNFADWLSRFFLRLSNSERLSSDQRTKKEFLVGEEMVSDRNFTVFLERFSQDSHCYPMDARTFVAELHRRWSERNPEERAPVQGPAVQAGGAIFVSYCSQDIEAARKLFDDASKICGDAVWFDKRTLKSGDEFDRRIRTGIQRCGLFLPLLSANTEQRTEGYFRLEWREAAERSRRIQGRKFIFPIVIDPDYTGGIESYKLVPEEFRALQYSHAPGGQMTGELKAELTEQLRSLRRARAV